MSAIQPKLAKPSVQGAIMTRLKSKGGMRSVMISTSSPNSRINIFESRNQSPVWIFCRELKAPLDLADSFGAEDMLDFIGIFMDVVGSEMDGVRQIKFPQAMVANDLAGALPAGRREEKNVALFVGGDETVARQLRTLRAGIFDALAPQLGQLSERDSFAAEIALFEDAVNGLESVFPADA